MIVEEIIDVERHNKIKNLKRIQQMTAMSQAMGMQHLRHRRWKVLSR